MELKTGVSLSLTLSVSSFSFSPSTLSLSLAEALPADICLFSGRGINGGVVRMMGVGIKSWLCVWGGGRVAGCCVYPGVQVRRQPSLFLSHTHECMCALCLFWNKPALCSPIRESNPTLNLMACEKSLLLPHIKKAS